jgi:hypothetical protein
MASSLQRRGWLVVAAWALATGAFAQTAPSLSIEGATIIDGNGGTPAQGTLTIQGNRIGTVETAAQDANSGAFCINQQAEYYPYTGGVCRTGYQLGTHNCRTPDGELHMMAPADCRRAGGLNAHPAPAAAPADALIRPRPEEGPRN